MNSCIRFILILFCFALTQTSFGQLKITLAPHFVLGTVNPPQKFGFEQSSEVATSIGYGTDVLFSYPWNEQIGLKAGLGFHKLNSDIFYRVMEDANNEFQVDGLMLGRFLDLQVLVEKNLDGAGHFSFGGGLNYGLNLQSQFNGIERRIVDGEVEITTIDREVYESWHPNATALRSFIEYKAGVSSHLEITSTLTFDYFIRSRNLVFQDTGNTSEISLGIGLTYINAKDSE